MKTAIATLLGLLLTTSAFASSITLTVGGKSDPFLAGALPGTLASGLPGQPGEDNVLDHGPVLVPAAFGLVPGTLLKFEVTGGVLNVPGCLPPFDAPPCVGPDGEGGLAGLVEHAVGVENGLLNVRAPLNSLLGVFLGPGVPAPQPQQSPYEPGTLFTLLTPEIAQVFFIGDGNNFLGNDQHFLVPTGATRLFLATMDGFQWANNSGQFTVTISDVAITETPEPASLVLLGTGLAAALRVRRRRSR